MSFALIPRIAVSRRVSSDDGQSDQRALQIRRQGFADHSAGLAAIAFSSDGCGAVHVAGERLRPNRKAATIA